MPLPAEVKQLMLNTVVWEAFASKDAHGDETYATPVDLLCHVELATDADRPPDETRFVPRHDLYFDGGQTEPQSFTLNDRFTVSGPGDGLPLQAKAIDPVYGPAGDAWLIKVTVG
jgi:hypothetical protein